MGNKKFLCLQLFADPAQADPGNADPAPADQALDDQGKADPGKADPAGKKPEEEKPGAKYTDDDMDKIINKKFAEWQKKKDAEIDEAKKLANMTQEQKTAHELKQLRDELDGYKHANVLTEMGKTARGILSEKGISVSDNLASLLVSDDAATTKKAVDEFASLFESAVEQAVKNKLKGETPKAGKAASGMTKEQIMAIKDPSARKKAIAENIGLFS